MIVFITGYGIGPTSTTSGEPHCLNGASSRSASSGRSGVEDDHGRELVPEPSGACTRPAKTVRSSGRVRDRVAVEAQQFAGRLDRMRDQTARHHRQRVQPVLERGGDAEVAAAAAQRPEEIGMRLGGDVRGSRRPR